ncbi:2-hydroxycarboxylate transporter family protein [Mycoavidus sp. B2-EB]|uniref:2-hydroxycarboxylate transporter family protein n=1 Tax=Mycoavidus sp. B2-EB TaxID=2651972 RepID=UPI001624EFC3|nr:2-hydroxycarboxylate transporter family protein [Mycoavidus sp. B2-EB]BBO59937.1 citrate-sodium symporter [Mycoavidus sp. B2-EB]
MESQSKMHWVHICRAYLMRSKLFRCQTKLILYKGLPVSKSDFYTLWPHPWSALGLRLLQFRIGIMPLPLYCAIFACLCAFLIWGTLPSEISVMFATLAVLGFTCAELGARLPGLRRIGGPVLVTLLLPSGLVYYQWIPTDLVRSISEFWHATNILYLFTAAIIVASLLSMERRLLIQGCAKIFMPLAAGSIAAALVGTLTGLAFGLSAYDTFFYLVVPIMAGGLGEGAIPLTLGYAAILQVPQPQLFAQVVPPVVLGNLMAIICAALYHQFGARYLRYSAEGPTLLSGASARKSKLPLISVEPLAEAGMVALGLYMIGLVVHQCTAWPATIVMLCLAVGVKLTRMVSPKLEYGAQMMHHFFCRAVAYPLLFGIGLTLTPWKGLLAALTLANCVTIMATVLTLTTVGFVVGRWVGLHPVESAVINACHSGMGGIGDMAILTAADRMRLMPFAQLATRIGGALSVLLALILLAQIT